MASGLEILGKVSPIIAFIAAGFIWVGHTDGKIDNLNTTLQLIVKTQDQQNQRLDKIENKLDRR